jgi:Tfp pilus assembly protein PilO
MTVRKKYILAAILAWIPCVALGVAGYLFAIEPQMQRVATLEAELTGARELYSQATEAAKEQNQKELARRLQTVDDRVCDFVLRPEIAPDLAFEIAALASATEVASFTMKPQDKDGLNTVTNCDTIGERQISINFVSQFHQFAALLNALERHRPVLFVETFAINRPQRQTEKPRIDMQVAVLVEKPRGS